MEFKLAGGDNITQDQGTLVIAGHPSIIKFLIHGANQKFRSPSRISSFDLNSQKVSNLYHSDAEEISGGSTGLIVGDHLYIGQVFADYLWRVDLSGF